MKAALQIGLAAFIALSAQTVPAALRAADLLPPAPSLDSPALRGRFESESGAYVRADAGFGLLKARDPSSTFTAAPTGFSQDAAQSGRATLVGLGIGYRFNEYVRADLTGEYRGSASYSARASYVDAANCGAARCAESYAGSLHGSALMANVYGEIGSWFDVTPYVGLGAGVTQTSFGPVTVVAANGHGVGTAPRTTQARLSFALMAGASWDLTSKIKIEAGYRYMPLAAARSGAMACAPATGACAGQVQQMGLASHDLRIGLRYGLSGGAL